MYFIWLANILFIGIIAYTIGRSYAQGMARLYWPAFLVKILSGILLGILYRFYYTEGDTFPYYQDAMRIASLARTDFGQFLSFLWTGEADVTFLSGLNFQQPRAMFLAKAASIFSLVSSDNYWIIASYFSFMSFVASWLLVIQIRHYKEDALFPAIIGLLFFPSVVFWTSGLVKESLAMAGLYCVIILFLKIWQRDKISGRWWVVLPIALWLLWNLKYYYVAVLLPVLITALIFRFTETRWLKNIGIGVKVIVWMLILTVPVMLVSFIHPNFYPERILMVIVENHDALTAISSKNELIHYNHLSPTAASILLNSPKAIFSGLFRPLPWEAVNTMQLVASLENMMMVILFLTMLYSAIRRDESKRDHLGWLIIVYTVLLCMFLALSTPNFGTLSRYRVGFLPFFVVLLCYDNIVIQRLWLWLQRMR